MSVSEPAPTENASAHDATAPGSGAVAVVITHYNRPEFLRETIAAARNQTVPAAEIVVVDDGSPSGIWDVEAAFPGVRLITQTNQGPAVARNTGLAATESEFVVFCDGDDPLLPNALEAGIRALRASPDAGMATAFSRVIDTNGTVIAERLLPAPAPTDDLLATMFERTWVCPPGTVMYRRSVLEQIGGWHGGTQRWGAEDYDIILRAAHAAPVVVVDEIVCSYRANEGSMGTDLERMRDSIIWVLEDLQPLAATPRREAARQAGITMQRESYNERIQANQIRSQWKGHQYGRAAANAVRYAVRHPRVTLRRLRFR